MYFTNPCVAAGTTNSQTHLGMFVVTPPILWCAAMYSSAHRVLVVRSRIHHPHRPAVMWMSMTSAPPAPRRTHKNGTGFQTVKLSQFLYAMKLNNFLPSGLILLVPKNLTSSPLLVTNTNQGGRVIIHRAQVSHSVI
jgi:hypothetical protein